MVDVAVSSARRRAPTDGSTSAARSTAGPPGGGRVQRAESNTAFVVDAGRSLIVRSAGRVAPRSARAPRVRQRSGLRSRRGDRRHRGPKEGREPVGFVLGDDLQPDVARGRRVADLQVDHRTHAGEEAGLGRHVLDVGPGQDLLGPPQQSVVQVDRLLVDRVAGRVPPSDGGDERSRQHGQFDEDSLVDHTPADDHHRDHDRADRSAELEQDREGVRPAPIEMAEVVLGLRSSNRVGRGVDTVGRWLSRLHQNRARFEAIRRWCPRDGGSTGWVLQHRRCGR